jgi:putative DNA primase/helicase
MGTGKSKLVDLAAMIAIGHEAPVLAQGKTEEEMEKRLGAALLAGDTLVSFDNCEQQLGGELLCQALTQPRLKIRILGKSENAFVPTNAAFFATGNNLEVIGDMTRRTLVCSLDARVERPETRIFKNTDPVEVVRDNRAKYVVAALTILRAYHVATAAQRCRTPRSALSRSGRVGCATRLSGSANPIPARRWSASASKTRACKNWRRC